MDLFIYTFITIAYVGILLWGINLAKNNTWFSISNVLILVIIALIYDNAIVAMGGLIGEGRVLKGLNYARYWLHALCTPLLVLYAWKIVENTGIKWISKEWVRIGTSILVIILIFIEVATVITKLELVAKWKYGVLAYENVDEASAAPIMVIVVTLVLLIASIFIWWKLKWRWFFIGTIIMIIGSIVPLPIKSEALTNGLELILIITLMATRQFQERIG
ncbi:hypothetical protein ACFYKT_05970 [Cytobacillus sp. FJAT-53684]|uniref:Phospholipid phosphatase n=1 Tax=Cytobacillus mangrovibacter TaxID=3299024 RepID=A0ABW6JZI1_9BACI